ncbi:F-box/FBD/LRR-repeat protein At1g13570-like [Miscanthus floridulus]|uniref:F-box/FBD/LRR-repeat protein At1g13570-like n=1 Tax=Miscanthus floridulus TaxID=154761 RepID=UPI003458AEF4
MPDRPPDEVVLEILRRLDIRDAVRTSALSRAWRHRWRHLPVLDFRDCSFGRLGMASAAQSVLLGHLALVDAFALDAHSPPLPEADHPRLDDLLVHLSSPRHPLEVLVLKLPSYKLHSSIFSRVKLKYLDLKENSSKRLLKPVEKPCQTGPQFDMLAALISGCPGLEELAVKVVPEVAGVTLKIAAPRLRHLEIKACSTGWMVGFVSLLPDLACAKLQLPFFRYAQEGGVKASAYFPGHFARGGAGVA